MYSPPKKRSSKKKPIALSPEQERAMLIDQIYSPIWSQFSMKKLKTLLSFSKKRGVELTSKAKKTLSAKEQEALRLMGKQLLNAGKHTYNAKVNSGGSKLVDALRKRAAVKMIAPPYRYLSTHDVEDDILDLMDAAKKRERKWSKRQGYKLEKYITTKAQPHIEKFANKVEAKGKALDKAYQDWALKKCDTIKKDTGATDIEVAIAVDNLIGRKEKK